MADPKRYALIRAGVVENVILADDTFAAGIEKEWDAVVALRSNSRAAPGWTYDGSSFTQPPTPEPTPEEVRAARLQALREQDDLTPEETTEAVKLLLGGE